MKEIQGPFLVVVVVAGIGITRHNLPGTGRGVRRCSAVVMRRSCLTLVFDEVDHVDVAGDRVLLVNSERSEQDARAEVGSFGATLTLAFATAFLTPREHRCFVVG